MGTVGSNPTLSATQLAHSAHLCVIAHKRPITGRISTHFGRGRSSIPSKQALNGANMLAHSLVAMHSVTFPCITGNLQRIRYDNRRVGSAFSIASDRKPSIHKGLRSIADQGLLIGETGYLIGRIRDVARPKQAFFRNNRRGAQLRLLAQSN